MQVSKQAYICLLWLVVICLLWICAVCRCHCQWNRNGLHPKIAPSSNYDLSYLEVKVTKRCFWHRTCRRTVCTVHIGVYSTAVRTVTRVYSKHVQWTRTAVQIYREEQTMKINNGEQINWTKSFIHLSPYWLSLAFYCCDKTKGIRFIQKHSIWVRS